MKIYIGDNLNHLKKDLERRGYRIIEKGSEKPDVYIYKEDCSYLDYSYYNKMTDGVTPSVFLNAIEPSSEGALLINACNKTMSEIIEIIESRVYSKIF